MYVCIYRNTYIFFYLFHIGLARVFYINVFIKTYLEILIN